MNLLFVTILLLQYIISLNGFAHVQRAQKINYKNKHWMTTSSSSIGDLLCDLQTPSLLLELSLAENAVANTTFTSLDNFLLNGEKEIQNDLLEGSIFIHTKVVDTSERDAITKEQGSGKSLVICQVNTPNRMIPGGAFLGIGLANHHVGGYYWARGMGMGASLPAHGIYARPVGGNTDHDDSSSVELYWKKRGPGMDAKETTEESSNSNDGKRSEWADFLTVGDTVQLVPENAATVLHDAPFEYLLGVRRIGRPLGADPIVEKVWIRSENGWVSK